MAETWFGLEKRKKINQIINTNSTVLYCTDLPLIFLCSHLMIIKSSETNNKANNKKPYLQKALWIMVIELFLYPMLYRF
jgi:hypothetical protein